MSYAFKTQSNGVVISRRCRHGLAGCALGGAAKVCAPRFFVTGSFQSSVRGKETVAVMQPKVSICVRCVARAIVNAGTRNKWVHFPKMADEKAAAKEEFLWVGPLPSVIGYVNGSFVASRSEQKAPFWRCEGYFALYVMFICVEEMPILALDPLR
ncbi:hypothetical protein HPB51_014032 [Rhipicephalus microplus]|uniref:Uncharacterized protein n=1 Tax=Rhipicephalus microplus TaxID=6941 RepID=A0A9J6DAU3_RHIMP|nr:hypothetical protein HPB51_014032 [Rhipicephalus microplus]